MWYCVRIEKVGCSSKTGFRPPKSNKPSTFDRNSCLPIPFPLSLYSVILNHKKKMPLWLVFHPPGTFEDANTKQALTKDVTKIYTGVGLPAFYVVVNFIKLSTEDTWVGGERRTENPFIRIAIEHIAVRLEDDDQVYKRTADAIERALKPHIADKGYDWEFHVDETERRLWRVNGMVPPSFGSEVERQWATENRPSLYDGAS